MIEGMQVQTDDFFDICIIILVFWFLIAPKFGITPDSNI